MSPATSASTASRSRRRALSGSPSMMTPVTDDGRSEDGMVGISFDAGGGGGGGVGSAAVVGGGGDGGE